MSKFVMRISHGSQEKGNEKKPCPNGCGKHLKKKNLISHATKRCRRRPPRLKPAPKPKRPQPVVSQPVNKPNPGVWRTWSTW